MKPRCLLRTSLLALALLAGPALAADEGDLAEFSSEAYCLLAHDGTDPRYLAAYARRLGTTPSARSCRSLLGVVDTRPPKAWDYRHRRPYADSAIRLSVAQLAALRAARGALAAR
jgi:hypothetical protein